ncbi:T9SS type B sorting domain-containing protein [Bizionia myxarmorum]|uniref:T9SS type B sorting domain-containing protein n=1 Tax=Bizionia myxarmorum TaxID=291186 RepID=A0A5D0RD51_9FLAO|nr:T9SS type B sorting domain-containing protein [Bizionia myxarmorum]TYB79442.1 T9SS type B sorting domain-containing protein [Bizionia myxarmorum]
MKKIITLVCLLFITSTYAQLIAIDDVVVGRADNPIGGPAIGDRIFINDYFNGTAITFANYLTFTMTETVADPNGFITFNPLGFVSIAPNTPQGIYYVTYQICENANPTNCDTAQIEVRVFPATISSGSGSSEITVSTDTGGINCGGSVCITDEYCVDLNTGTIPPLTLSADFNVVGNTNSYVVNPIDPNPPFSYAEASAGIPLTSDDDWSGVLNFIFDFKFYGQTYTQCVLSTNGAVSFNLGKAGVYHPWNMQGAPPVLPNTAAPWNGANIFGAMHDTNPGTSGVQGVDYDINYQVKGEAPFRAFVFSTRNVAHFQCTAEKTYQMIVFYESTNIIETYISQKGLCSWNGSLASIGIQNPAMTQGAYPPGRANNVFTVDFLDPEAYQFLPNGGTTITTFEWLAEDGTVLSTDPTGLTVTPSETTTYVAQVTYTDTTTGAEYVAYKPITVVVSPTPVITVTTGGDICEGDDAVFTLTGGENDVVQFNINGAPTETVTLDATGIFNVPPIVGATVDQVLTITNTDNLNSVCGGPLSLATTISVFATPVVDEPADLTACNDYELPALTVGDYYTATGGPGGTGTLLNATDVITTTQDIFVYAETGTTPNCFDEHMFTITIDACTLAVSANNVTICSDAGADVTLTATPSPTVPIGNYSYSWNVQGDPTPLETNSTYVISPPPTVTTTYEVTLTDDGLTAPNNTVTNTVTVTVNTTPIVDNPTDVTECDTYTLPTLTSGDYYTGPGGTGTLVADGTSITTTQTLYVYGETGTTPNCSDENSFLITINDTPIIDSPADVTACDTFELPALSGGQYYNGPGGTGGLLTAGSFINTTQTIYVYAETATTPNCSAENSFVVTINDTPAADAPGDVSICNEYVLPALTNGTYFTGAGGTGTSYNAGDTITTSQTIYVYAETGTTPNCFTENSFDVTINICTISVTANADMLAICNDAGLDVTLSATPTPAAAIGTYSYSWNVQGDATVLGTNDTYLISPPPAVTTTYEVTLTDSGLTAPNNTATNTVTITVNTTPIVDDPIDVTACDTYVLPVLGSGNYYTGTGGTGFLLNAGESVTTSQTIYVYGETATTPNCTDENSFDVTINNTPVIDAPADVIACDSYELPALTGGQYFNGTGGTGGIIAAGTIITTSQTIYVYAETGTTPNCSIENVFDVTINTTPIVDAPIDVTMCDSYTLPALTNGAYFTGANGTGTALTAGQDITSTQTIYVYAETATTPNCSAENSFLVTINDTPIADAPVDVTICDSYILPALNVGTYYTGTGGTGIVLNAGESITTTQVIYVFAETGTTPNCFDENDFTVTINTTPLVDDPADVTECVTYTLPAITNGTYYSGAGGTGTVLTAGETITATQTIYVYAETGTTPNCSAENSFVVTINPLPTIFAPAPLVECDDNVADGMTVMNLTIKNVGITGNNPNYNVTYYNSAAAAIAGTPQVTPSANAYIGTNNEVVFVRVEDATTGCFDTTSLTLNVVEAPAVPAPTALHYCDPDNNGFGIFDLTDIRNDIEAMDPTFEVSFHLTNQNAIDDVNPQPNVLANVMGQIIYIRVDYGPSANCPTILPLPLIVDPTPVVPQNIADYEECDVDYDGITSFNLTNMDATIYDTQNPADYDLTYHETLADAQAEPGVNPILEPQLSNYVSADTIIYVRLQGLNGCVTTGQFNLVVNLPPTIAVRDGLFPICDDDISNDGYASFDLISQDDIITGYDPSLNVDYYESMADVIAGTPIPNYADYTNASVNGLPHNPQTIFVKVTETTSGSNCTAITTLTLIVNALPTPTPTLLNMELCDDNNPGDLEEEFDITANEAAMMNEFNESVTYHINMADAESGANPIPNPTTYTNLTPTQTIYVRVTKTGDPNDPLDLGTGCATVVTFDIIVNPLPDAPASVDDIIACDDPFDTFYTFNLKDREAQILGDQNNVDFNVTYYTTLAAAELGAGGIVNPTGFTNTVNPQEIFVNIRNTTTNCDIATTSFFIIVQEAAVANPDNMPLEFSLCDDNMEFDGNTTNDSVGFDLVSQNGSVLDGQDPANFIVSYYENQADADIRENAIDTNAPYENTVNPQIIYVRVDNDTTADDICFDITTMTLTVDSIPAFTLEDSYTLCVDTNGTEVVGAPILDTELDASLFTFEWTEAADPTVIIGTDSSYEATAAGTYTILVTDNTNLCPSMLTTEVILSSPPSLVAEVTTFAFANNHEIAATATGTGSAQFEFSIDNGPWLSNTPSTNTYTFSNVSIGSHVIRARDINGCGEAVTSVLVLDYPLFFTPNNDGDNDTWQITNSPALANVKILIFDRYGKLLKQLNPNGPGWDGTLNGYDLPSSDYWFTIDYKELPDEGMKQFKAHFTLKR